MHEFNSQCRPWCIRAGCCPHEELCLIFLVENYFNFSTCMWHSGKYICRDYRDLTFSKVHVKVLQVYYHCHLLVIILIN